MAGLGCRSSGVPSGLPPLHSMVLCISLMVKVVEHFMYLLFVLLMTVVCSFARFIIGVCIYYLFIVCLFIEMFLEIVLFFSTGSQV